MDDDERAAVSLLVEQHKQIADQFRRTRDADAGQRPEAFAELRRQIAVHETIEEVLVHPRLRWVDKDGDAEARVRTGEEERIKSALVALESMDVDSAEFEEALAALQAMALTHNAAEEAEEFPTLTAALDDHQLTRLRRGIALVEKIAPTRPHPSVTLGGENVLVGGFTSLIDRVRDALSRDS